MTVGREVRILRPEAMNFACPQCGKSGPDSWDTSNEVFALMKVRKGEQMPVKYSGHEGLPVIPHFCRSCGYAVFFRAELSDITET